MKAGSDFRIRHLGQTVLTLRPDLVIIPRLDGNEPGYLIEDRLNSKFFRIGMPEYTFISLLDGRTTVDEALSITARVEPEHAFSHEQAASICSWLVENQLAFTSESIRTERLSSDRQQPSGNAAWKNWNPWFLRIPLFHPDALFVRLSPWIGWLFSMPATVLATLLGCTALYQVFTHWNRFLASAHGILATDRWLWIGLCWLLLKVLHEIAHGVVCKRYGGNVREAGVVLILAAPVAYVDVTSSWRFRSKWLRIHTAAAGMYLELIVAAVAALIWSQSRPGIISDLCFQVVVMASITTILFNANPLMRFDGYYIISDLLEIPNLYSQGQQWLRHFARKYLWGLPSIPPSGTWSHSLIVCAYGVAACIWRVLICVGLTVAASRMFQGAGIVLAVVGVAFWIGPPTWTTLKYLIWGAPCEQPRRLRFLLGSGGLLALAALASVYLPWPCPYRAPCMVDYAPSAMVRAASPGFVHEIRVRPGQSVRQNQVLAVMTNEKLRLELADLNLQVEQSAGRMRQLLHDGKLAEYQAEREQLASLQKRQREKQQEVDALILRAPVDGRVVADDLESLRGTYLSRGTAVLVIGQENRKELILSIAQQDVDVFSAARSQGVRIRIRGGGTFAATLTKVAPRAHSDPPDPAFCAPLGGPLPVRPALLPQEELEQTTRYELLTPRFDGTVSLNPERSLSLFAGQRGIVTLEDTDRSIAAHLAWCLRKWMRRSFNRQFVD